MLRIERCGESLSMNCSLLTYYGTDNSVYRDAYAIRLSVFSDEQGISKENERDEFDDTAYHCVIYVDKQPVACGRLNISNESAKICRIAVMKTFRENGYATQICNHCISFAQQNGAKYIYLHSQTYIADLYEMLGFTCEGKVFLEENIPHIRMVKKL